MAGQDMLNVIKTLKNLKSSNKFETLENYSMLGIIFGALVFAGGIGLTAITTSGIPAIITMFGAVIAFCASVFLVFVWLAKEIFGKREEE